MVEKRTARDFEERANDLRFLLVPHRQYTDAIARFETFRVASQPRYDDPQPRLLEDGLLAFEGDDDDDGDTHVQALMIVGPSGSGKSGVLKTISHRPELRAVYGGLDGDVRPCVRMDLPDHPTPKEVVKEVCFALRSPAPNKWTLGEVARHLRGLFRDVGLRFLLMDEAHVLVDNLTERKITTNARFLKFLLVSCRVPIVLAGEEPLENLLRHKALKRRMHPPIRLGPYVWGDYAEVKEWMSLVGALVDYLGFPRTNMASDLDLSMRLYLDTGGAIGLLAQRLVEAGRLAHADANVKLTKIQLSRAWAEWSAKNQLVAKDPFAIVEASTSRSGCDPYTVKPERLKELWLERFHARADIDDSRTTRRGSRKADNSERGFGR